MNPFHTRAFKAGELLEACSSWMYISKWLTLKQLFSSGTPKRNSK